MNWWRLARSLETLRSEFNTLAPRRSKASDGTIGDPAHASRASRHNPNRHKVVTALDITHDPANGCDVHAIARELVKDPHPELEYIISDRQIASRKDGFRWRGYQGSNPHTKHAHFAVGRGSDYDPLPPYDSTAPWGVADMEEDMAEVVEGIQRALTAAGYDPKGVDGIWGKNTEGALASALQHGAVSEERDIFYEAMHRDLKAKGARPSSIGHILDWYRDLRIKHPQVPKPGPE